MFMTVDNNLLNYFLILLIFYAKFLLCNLFKTISDDWIIYLKYKL